MADLAEALDAALTDRYGVTVVKRPATHRQGLTARMRALEKLHPGGRKGSERTAAAKAAGISPRTWREWHAGKRQPSPRLLQKLEDAFKRLVVTPKMRRKLKAQGVPNTVRVTAKINWNGYKNRTEQRTTDLGGMRGVMANVIRAWHRQGPEEAAEVFEQGAASAHSTGYIKFEGDQVEVEFPWE